MYYLRMDSISSFEMNWICRTGTCLNDKKEPLYIELNPSIWLFENLKSCCSKNTMTAGMNRFSGTGLWYADYTMERGVTDCEEGAGGSTCGGIAAPVSTYFLIRENNVKRNCLEFLMNTA